MGLDISLDTWHGAYSLFARWRTYLASLGGYHVIQLWKTGEFDRQICWHCGISNPDDFPSPHVCIDWAAVTDDQIRGQWLETPEDALLVLITHSDCDGTIYPRDAGPLADRLEELLPRVNDGAMDSMDTRPRTKQFIKGLRMSASLNRPLVFA